MKRASFELPFVRILATTTFFLTLACSSYGQGWIWFVNYVPGSIDAPISDVAGNRIINPSPYLVDLFWSTDLNAPASSLAPAAFNVGFLPVTPQGGGYFNGSGRTLPATGGGTQILAQVRAWDTRFGSTYQQARDSGGEFGYSGVIQLTLSAPLAEPAHLLGLQPFQLQVIPEPSTVTLGVLGICMLFTRRRSVHVGAKKSNFLSVH